MKKLVLLAAIAAIGLVACKNQSEMLNTTDSSVRSKAPVSKDIRYFESYEQLSKEIDKTANMSFDELCKYEASIGFNSFGKISDLAYNEIAENEENYKSIEEVRDAIAKYPEYLLLTKDEKEDYTLETKLENSPYQYIVNKEQMFQVKDTLIKVLRDVEIFASVERYELLRKLDEAEIEMLAAEAQHAPASYDCEFLYEVVKLFEPPVIFKVYMCDGVKVSVKGDAIPHVPLMSLGRGFEMKDYSDAQKNRMWLVMRLDRGWYFGVVNYDQYYFSCKTHRKSAGTYWRKKRDVEYYFDVYVANAIPDSHVYWKNEGVYNKWHTYDKISVEWYINTLYFQKTRGYIKAFDGVNLGFNLDLDNTY